MIPDTRYQIDDVAQLYTGEEESLFARVVAFTFAWKFRDTLSLVQFLSRR